jgi:ABC-2 type transport system ATP-binding protein
MNLLIDSVGKQYRGNVWGLQNISLQLRPGVLGLLGPNGAGKSTLMRILATVTRPTRGCVFWNDADALSSPDPLRMVLGYLPQDFGIYPQLSAFEFLEYLAAVKGLEPFSARRRVDELLSVVNLTDVRDRPLGGFSGGMRQRVGIAQALLNDPQLFWAFAKCNTKRINFFSPRLIPSLVNCLPSGSRECSSPFSPAADSLCACWSAATGAACLLG